MKTLETSANSGKKRDLSDLCGTWTKRQYEEFQKNMDYFNQIDSEIWLYCAHSFSDKQ